MIQINKCALNVLYFCLLLCCALVSDSCYAQQSFATLAKQVTPAVVSVYSFQTSGVHDTFNDPIFRHFFGTARNQKTMGSGVIIDSNGTIVTNHHVIAGNSKIHIITSDGKEFDAKVIVSDQQTDIALLQIESEQDKNFPILELGDSDVVEVGDPVLAIGNPFGLGSTVTSGIVSAVGRGASNVSNYNFFIQTDAAINMGNSGGPLVNMDGQVIGINTAIQSPNGGFIGIGFAIPSNTVLNLIKNISKDYTGNLKIIHPWLGGQFQNMTAEMREAMGIKESGCVIVTSVTKGGSLERADILPGDVILNIDGHHINDAQDLKRYTWNKSVGDHVKIYILDRSGLYRTLHMTLVAPPSSSASEYICQHPPFKGVVFENLSPFAAAELELEAGVMVRERSQRSNIYGFDLQVGDVIISINGHNIMSIDDLRSAIESNRGRQWIMKIIRDGRSISVRLVT